MTRPFEKLLGGMAKLGPGSDAETLRALRALPRSDFEVVVDAGCGAGRQTPVLAREVGLEGFVDARRLDMRRIPEDFPSIDLLWSEGAAYAIGFAEALKSWRPSLGRDGCAVISELCWLDASAPDSVASFFRDAHPGMRSVSENRRAAEEAEYEVLETRTLAREAWTEGYYEVLEPRARALLGDADPAVRELAAATLEEIEVFRRAEGSYGYVLFVLRAA